MPDGAGAVTSASTWAAESAVVQTRMLSMPPTKRPSLVSAARVAPNSKGPATAINGLPRMALVAVSTPLMKISSLPNTWSTTSATCDHALVPTTPGAVSISWRPLASTIEA